MNVRSQHQHKISISVSATLIFFGTCFTQCGPKKKTDEGILTDHSFTNQQVGWTIEFPGKEWKLMNVDVLKEIDKKGLEAVETMGQKVDVTGVKNLIGFRIDDRNIFESTIQRFDTGKYGSWIANNAYVKKMIMQVYASKGMKADSTETTFETIDGKKFAYYKVTIFKPDSAVLLTQLVYNRLINGFDFGAIISTNNEENMNTMREALMNSKFTK